MSTATETWRLVETDDARLEVGSFGSGPPLLAIGTALTVDELLPVARDSTLSSARTVHALRRRGYGASEPRPEPRSIAGDARDAVELLDALEIDAADVVGVSYSAAVALQLAADAPDRVRRLCLVEPPPMLSKARGDFVESGRRLLAEHAELGSAVATERFMHGYADRHWRLDLDRLVPGSVARVDQDASAFFDSDVPALLDWSFTGDDAAAVAAPTLLVGAADSRDWFRSERAALMKALPKASEVVVLHADHSLALTHAAELAHAIATFLEPVHLGDE
ncbi:alpha/beta fold hydrolase [Demequina pelophila]|uniref:alpha/beta fold hydrolase n=1 Tax=Demequina pelophila TaxID=1638984 RepID=UPI000784BDB0|nr:alpha/beta fold hydrolase [Demequina pelophila]